MERIAYKIALDVTKAESQKFLTGFSVGETRARVLKITLNNGRNPVHFDGSETISMFVTKPSDTSPSIGLCYLEGDTIVYNVLQSDVSEEGPTRFSIKVEQIEDDLITVLYAAHFTIQVTDPECDDSHVPDDPNYSILEQLIAEVEQFDSDAEAFAIGTRGGVPVTEDDPAYHNNAKYYSDNLEYEVEEQVERAEAWASGTRGGVPVSETDPQYHNNAKYHSEQAATSATNAGTSETNAAASESAASGSASSASANALKAEGFAVGEQGGTPVGDTSPYYHNNAEYFKDQAATSATNAGNSETAASGSALAAAADALKAEGFAVGKQNGADVGNTSPYYHNNAEYFKNQASQSATNAGTSETNAAASELAASGSATTASNQALVSEGWAKGKQNGVDVGPDSPYYHNNAEYFKNEAHGIVGDKVDSFNNRTGPVIPIKGDYNSAKIEIDPSTTSLPNSLDTLQDYLEYMYPPGVSVTLTLNGAKNDVITIKDGNDQTVATCTFATGQTSGSVQLTVPVGGGTYKFISSVAKDTTTGTSDYEKTVVLTDAVSQTVNVYPNGVIYWYGNGSLTGNAMEFRSGGVTVIPTLTSNTNSISYSGADTGSFAISGEHNFTGYSKINCLLQINSSSNTVTLMGKSSIATPANVDVINDNELLPSGGTLAKGIYSVSVTANGDNYAVLHIRGGNENPNDNAGEVWAVWLSNEHEDDIIILGAKEDTITITDSQNQTVATCVFGSGNTYGYVSKALLPAGTYTFTSSVAKDTTDGTSDYEKTITLDGSETEIKVMPDGAVYWYGNGTVVAQAYKASASTWTATAPTLVTNTNDFVATITSGSGDKTGTVWLNPNTAYDISDYTSLKVEGKCANNASDSGYTGIIGADAYQNNFTRTLTASGLITSTSYAIYTYTLTAADKQNIQRMALSISSQNVMRGLGIKRLWFD